MTDSFNAETNGGSTPQSPASSGSTFNTEANQTAVEFEVNGRKYNVDDAKTKITHQDKHIETLEAEGRATRDKLAKMEAEIARLNGIKEVLERKQSNTSESTTIDSDEVARQAASLVTKTLEENERVRREQDNLGSVKQALTKKYGKDVDEVVSKVIGPLGMTKSEAMEMAKTKPKAFMAYFDKVSAASPVPTTGNMNTQTGKKTEEPSTRNVFNATSEKERVNIYQERLAKKLQEIASGGA